MKKLYRFDVRYQLGAVIFVRADSPEGAKEAFNELPKPDVDTTDVIDSLIRTDDETGSDRFPYWRLDNGPTLSGRLAESSEAELKELEALEDEERAEILALRDKKGVSDK